MRWQLYGIRVFLSRSAQRVSIFQNNVEREVSVSASSRQKVKPICATRWVERHDSIIIFVTLLPAVVSTLGELQQENKQLDVATKTATLLNSVQKCTFFYLAQFSVKLVTCRLSFVCYHCLEYVRQWFLTFSASRPNKIIFLWLTPPLL